MKPACLMRRVGFRKLLATFCALFAASTASVFGNTFSVTNTGDSADPGSGSLRRAIADANANSGSDTIAFDIPDTDPGCAGTPKICTIKPATNLPNITGPVLIDGYTQPGASANTLPLGDDAKILIELDATNLNPALYLDGTVGGGGAGGSTILGLALTHVASYAAIRATHVDNLTITGNFIGTDASGTTATSSASYGIYADNGTATVVGGILPAERNIIAGNPTALFIEGTGATDCIVQGNYIGLDKSGTAPLSVTNGVQLRDTTNCLIGGSVSGAGNVIGSATQGISVDTEVLNGGANDTTIQGNLIGTDATGTVRLGQFYGLVIGSGSGTHVGGTGVDEGNLISGNAADGIIAVNSPKNLLIEGNRIGTDITGTLPLGNGWCGIDVSGFASGTNAMVGGATAGAGNLIAFNGTNGISVTSNNVGWAIEGNSIRDNTDMGIVLNGRCDDHSSHPTDNDAGDADTGPNNLQNYPVITAVTIGPKTMAHVSGTLNSTADTTFRVEFFANASCDPNGHGEGRVFVGSADVPTIGNDASFGTLDIPVPAHRHVITATATDPNNNTSEFSDCAFEDTIFTDGYDGD